MKLDEIGGDNTIAVRHNNDIISLFPTPFYSGISGSGNTTIRWVSKNLNQPSVKKSFEFIIIIDPYITAVINKNEFGIF
jgi:hypothetical protein